MVFNIEKEDVLFTFFFALSICYTDARNCRILSCVIQVDPYNTTLLSKLKWAVCYKPFCSPSPALCTTTTTCFTGGAEWRWSDDHNHGSFLVFLMVSSLHQSLWEQKEIGIYLEIEPFRRWLNNGLFPSILKEKIQKAPLWWLSTYLLCSRIFFYSELL